MKLSLMKCMIVVCALSSTSFASSIWYVSLNSATNGPGTEWGNAFHVIQDAVDSTTNGDTVLVDSGIYNTGTNKTPGHIVPNCVVITNDITVQSVNGAAATIIDAYGSYTRRGVYMSAGTLKGFSVINGSTTDYGDDNYDKSGGGINMYGGTGNVMVIDCVVSNNSSYKFGGGVCCGSIERCIVVDNNAGESGGGVRSVDASSCAIYGNWANLWGGGSYGGVLVNSTVSGNGSAYGGGVYSTVATNSIIWNNDALHNENWDKGSLSYCCTHPVPPGIGNFDNNPLLLDGKHIYISSPCTGVGDAAIVPSLDLDNEAWSTPPAVGCDQPASSIYDDISAYISYKYNSAVVGKKIDFRANMTGTPKSISWSFGDATAETNIYNISHSWSSSGEYSVSLRVFNDNYPTGKEVNCTVYIKNLSEASCYVNLNSTNAVYPYTSWATAASNIQDAVYAAEHFGIAGAEVVVTDGLYQVGEEYVSGYFPDSSNRVVINKDIVVRSVHGRDNTFIKGKRASTYNGLGNDAVRCVYMSAGHLEGFTLTNGYTRASGDPDFEQSGGGANLYGGLATISDCVFATNTANNYGGGLYFGKADNCILSKNSAMGGAGAMRAVVSNCLFIGNNGGGLSFGYAYDSTFTSNRASWGGAAYYSDLYNCNISGNRAEGSSASGGGISACNFCGGVISNNLSEKNGGGAESSTIIGAVICNNHSYKKGGGVCGSTVSNSVICNNIADDSDGGGADGSTLYNCLIVSNKVFGFIPGPPDTNIGEGGGASGSCLYNCTVANNYANNEDGGVYNCTLTNSIIWDNIAENTNNNYGFSSLDYCCTTPSPSSGNNTEGNPLFMNPAEKNYHLRVYSPCVDSGTNLAGIIDDDLDGEARPIDGDVDGLPAWDMGCYEYDAYTSDSDNDGMSDGWEYLNGLDPTNELDATVDSDSDTVVNVDEYIADTSPTNKADFFKITAITNDTSVTVYFKSSSRRAYVLQGCSNLNNNVWGDISGGSTRVGVDGSDSMSDGSPFSNIGAYRVMVEVP